jgi:hypothetical protein
VDRRHRAQHRQRQIEGLALLVQLRHDRHLGAVDVGDHAQQVALVELARLGGDVRRRVMKPEERADIGADALGGDLARTVGGETIDHHPIVARERTDLPRALVQEGGHALRLVEPCDHRADGAGDIALILAAAGLRFEDDPSVRHVQRDVERPLVARKRPAAEDALDGIGSAQHRHAVAQPVHRGGREQLREGPAEQGVRLFAEKLGDVRGHARDHPVRRQGDEIADRLDGAELMDGFPVTIREVDPGMRFGHDTRLSRTRSPPASKQWNVCRAAPTAASTRAVS